ncbi:MAG: hypothetical protein ACRCVU_04975 [Flavobacterium sp.]
MKKVFILIGLLLVSSLIMAQSEPKEDKYAKMEKYLMERQGKYTSYDELIKYYSFITNEGTFGWSNRSVSRSLFIGKVNDRLKLKGFKIIENSTETGVAIVKDCK